MKAPAFFAVSALWLAIVDLDAGTRWITLEDCQYLSNPANDGDSFHVRAKGKHYIFRLYFVDAPETDQEAPDRLDEQAKYFGVTAPQVAEVGEAATAFAREKLATPFTVRTSKQDAMGRSKLPRFYAFIETGEGDLGEQLIANGLARVHGASATPPDASIAQVQRWKLQGLERQAREQKIGAWGLAAGRLNVRAQTSQGPRDYFDAIFHPAKRAAHVQPSAGSPVARSPIAGAVSGSPTTISKLDVNTATEQQLENVPGIGPVLAGRIIAARPFQSANDLRKVQGIGRGKRYEKIRPYFN